MLEREFPPSPVSLGELLLCPDLITLDRQPLWAAMSATHKGPLLINTPLTILLLHVGVVCGGDVCFVYL